MAQQTDHLSAIFSALADPTRRALIARLAEGPATVTELAAPFDLSLPAVSKHLKVLQRGRARGAGTPGAVATLPLRPEPLRDVVEWLERYREFSASATTDSTRTSARSRVATSTNDEGGRTKPMTDSWATRPRPSTPTGPSSPWSGSSTRRASLSGGADRAGADPATGGAERHTTMTVEEMDVRPAAVALGEPLADGDAPFCGEYLEVEPPGAAGQHRDVRRAAVQ